MKKVIKENKILDISELSNNFANVNVRLDILRHSIFNVFDALRFNEKLNSNVDTNDFDKLNECIKEVYNCVETMIKKINLKLGVKDNEVS